MFVGPPWDQMHFVWLNFLEILVFFSQSLTGDFAMNLQRTCFYGVLGDVARRGCVGPP